jgi:L-ascorbate metabolism protein UlaG (beta-lactamase superfamily)
VIVASPGAAEKLEGDVRVVHPGDEVTVGDVTVKAVPAYNTHRFRSPGEPFHPKEQEHVGYVVTVDGERVYFAGDTDHVPEMGEITCDVAMLPVGGKYTMDAEEAAEAAADIGPRVAVPMHFASGVVGEPADAERFRSLYQGEVFVFTPE